MHMGPGTVRAPRLVRKTMLTTTMTLAIATAMGTGPVAPTYNPAYPDLPPLPMEVLGGAKSPMIVIDRVKSIDNLDGGDFLSPDRADFYAIVTVNDIQYKTRIMAKDDGRPRWEIPLPRDAKLVRVKIRLMDEDGGLFGGDDHADISRGHNKKDVIFTYYPWSHRISGDVNGWLGESFYCRGAYDGDKAQVWFTVR